MDNEKATKPKFPKFVLALLFFSVILASAMGGAIADRLFVIKPLDYFMASRGLDKTPSRMELTQTVLREESVVIDVAEKSSPAVVTVAIVENQARQDFFDPFGIFNQQSESTPEQVQQDIGSGFVVDGERGFIVTNKHVVASSQATYKVITKDDKEYEVTQIYRDPVNDLAIIKVNDKLPQLELGDSGQLKVGQFVIAIGTALGEFRHTVTTGVISGLGRGIIAGGQFGEVAERLDNVIQTDAAINPGNSGGPLLNSAGQVIGVSVAVAAGSQNIGFAIPINVVKDSLANFNQTGQFNRPFLGVRYRMIPEETALMNDVPQGALIVDVVPGSPAEKAGMQAGDIIVTFDGTTIKDVEGGLAAAINKLKVGQSVTLDVYRQGERISLTVVMEQADQ